MALFDFISQRRKRLNIKQALSYITAYSPSFTSYNGGVYEMDLTRAAIHALSSNRSKLNPVIKGGKFNQFGEKLKIAPNDYMTLSQFLYKLSTIYEVEGNAFIVPI